MKEYLTIIRIELSKTYMNLIKTYFKKDSCEFESFKNLLIKGKFLL